MPIHVALVAPVFLANTLRYVRAIAALDDVRLALISTKDREALTAVDP